MSPAIVHQLAQAVQMLLRNETNPRKREIAQEVLQRYEDELAEARERARYAEINSDITKALETR